MFENLFCSHEYFKLDSVYATMTIGEPTLTNYFPKVPYKCKKCGKVKYFHFMHPPVNIYERR